MMSSTEVIKSMAWYSFLGLSVFAASFITSIFTGSATEHPLWNLDDTIAYYMTTIVFGSALPTIFRSGSATANGSTRSKRLRYA